MNIETQTSESSLPNDKLYLPLIGVLSILIPLVVAFLLFLPNKSTFIDGFNVRILPVLNACLNSMVAVLLTTGYILIRRKNWVAHRACMISASVLSALFLVFYVLYHSQAPTTPFGGQGFIRYIYFPILITHIVLAATIVPLALLSVYRGLNKQYDKHKKISRWTFPIWLYVSITGLIVYLMIAPYYPKS